MIWIEKLVVPFELSFFGTVFHIMRFYDTAIKYCNKLLVIALLSHALLNTFMVRLLFCALDILKFIFLAFKFGYILPHNYILCSLKNIDHKFNNLSSYFKRGVRETITH